MQVTSERVSKLRPFQRLNHFPSMLEICRKAALSRHMGRMAVRLPGDYNFYPQSMVLPDQLDDLIAALKRSKVERLGVQFIRSSPVQTRDTDGNQQ